MVSGVNTNVMCLGFLLCITLAIAFECSKRGKKTECICISFQKPIYLCQFFNLIFLNSLISVTVFSTFGCSPIFLQLSEMTNLQSTTTTYFPLLFPMLLILLKISVRREIFEILPIMQSNLNFLFLGSNQRRTAKDFQKKSL